MPTRSLHLAVVALLLLSLRAADAQDDGLAQIAFVSGPVGGLRIHVMDEHGGNVAQLTNGVGSHVTPAWSPDGRRLAYTAWVKPFQSELLILDIASGAVGRIGDTFRDPFDPHWSPDGRQLVFAASGRWGVRGINVINVDGTGIEQITDFGDAPAWSPDGRRIAFTRDDTQDIYVMDAGGANVTNITNNGAANENPTWSPDGRRIAFASAPGGGSWDIYTMDPNGGAVEKLTDHPDIDVWAAWSPDGTRIAYNSYREAPPFVIGGGVDRHTDIYTMDVHGADIQRLTNDGALRASWFDPATLGVDAWAKQLASWGWIKRLGR